MKITELKISPSRTWQPVGGDNPLVAVVKLASEKSVIECVLSDDAMRKMVELCADEIASAAKARMDEFAREVLALDAGKSSLMLGDD